MAPFELCTGVLNWEERWVLLGPPYFLYDSTIKNHRDEGKNSSTHTNVGNDGWVVAVVLGVLQLQSEHDCD